MSIPESQLEDWTHQGAVKTAKLTHESVSNALSEYEFPEDAEYDPYLQGSYRNTTNIRGDSDVDLVVELTSTFYKDISRLSESEKRRWEQARLYTTYGWSDFRRDVLEGLKDYYGSYRVTEGDKSIKLAGSSNRLDADVVVCATYRKYESFPGTFDDPAYYVAGMTFWTQEGSRQIINFPKLHYENGVSKNSDTDGRFKPTVRMFKHARSYMIDHGQIDKDLAPSYFVECLIYNAPSALFDASVDITYGSIILYFWALNEKGELADLQCQNHQLPLFGNRPDQWKLSDGQTFISALWDLWQNWS